MTDRMLPSGAPRTLHIADLSRNEYVQGKDDREPTVDLDQANVVSSLQSGTEPGSRAQHYPVLDLDLPAVLVPSSTPDTHTCTSTCRSRMTRTGGSATRLSTRASCRRATSRPASHAATRRCGCRGCVRRRRRDLA